MRLLITLLSFMSFTLHAAWQQAPSFHFTFEAAQSHCRSLGTPWRVPTIQELFELKGDQRFSQTESFWSANSTYDGISRGNTGTEGDGGSILGTKIGYSFFLRDGDITLSPISKKTGVICTNAPMDHTTPKYESSEAGTIDKDNALIWHPIDTFDKHTKKSYEAAQYHCESLQFQDRDWRLPTLEELYSIVTYSRIQPSVDIPYFGVMMSRYYWSDDPFSETEAYVVGFKRGSVATSAKDNLSYLRCVSDLEE